MSIISSYLENRKVTWGENGSSRVNAGVPQGSVLGPTLWNILYDGVLDIKLIGDSMTIGYADDLALIVMADNESKLMRYVDENKRRIQEWMLRQNLKLAAQKTEAIILKGKRKKNEIFFKIGDEKIVPKKQIKYLGVVWDEHCNFSKHVVAVTKKAEERTNMLSKILPNVGGANSEKRKLLYGVVKSIILYGAPIWHKAMNMDKYKKMLETLQRKMLLRVASAYRTVSTEALQVITGIVPIDLEVIERREIYEKLSNIRNANEKDIKGVKEKAREETLLKWQLRWSKTSEKGQWTKKLIPNVIEWVRCSHRKLDYFMTQFLTGHGSFRTYTHRIGKVEDDLCVYCYEVDDPEHTIFECYKWEIERRKMEEDASAKLRITNVAEHMLGERKTYEMIHKGIKNIMRKKERQETELQNKQ